jgi:hypothetical protein
LSFQSSQSTFAVFLAALEIADFFAGTTDETTTFRTFRSARNPATTPVESLLVAIRAGAETRLFEANANFAYELLISINK